LAEQSNFDVLRVSRCLGAYPIGKPNIE
jgi:hypothetical protein